MVCIIISLKIFFYEMNQQKNLKEYNLFFIIKENTQDDNLFLIIIYSAIINVFSMTRVYDYLTYPTNI